MEHRLPRGLSLISLFRMKFILCFRNFGATDVLIFATKVNTSNEKSRVYASFRLVNGLMSGVRTT